MKRKLPKQPNVGSVGSVYDDVEQCLIYEWLEIRYGHVFDDVDLRQLALAPETEVGEADAQLLGHSTERPICPARIEHSRIERPLAANGVARLVLSGESKCMPKWRYVDVDILAECWGPGMNRRASDVHRDPIAAPCRAAAVADPVREGSYLVGYLPGIDINVIVWWNPLNSTTGAWPVAIDWFPWGEALADACEELIGAFRTSGA